MAESKVIRENYILVQGWMIRDLQLKGNELIIYACIYGFSQAENQVFSGSLQYLADWTNTTKRSVMNCLQSLTEKGYIVKTDKIINGVKSCEYYAKNSRRVVKNFPYRSEKSSTGGSEKISPNNIDSYNLLNNTKGIIDIMDKSEFSPFKPNALTKELIEAGYISEDDLYIDQYNDITQEFSDKYSFEIVRSCVLYFIKRYKQQPKDEDGNEIENKVAYFRTAIANGAQRLERDNNKEIYDVGSRLYR